MTRQRDFQIDEVAEALADRAEELCLHLFPNGHRHGHEFEIGDVYGTPGRSLRVNLHGSRAGKWKDFGDPEKYGDLVQLIAWTNYNGDKRKAFGWALNWLGWRAGDPATVEKRKVARFKKKRRDEEELKRQDWFRRKAHATFLEAQIGLRDTPVDAYFRGRGLDLRRLGRQPRSLRFHPELYEPSTKGQFAAMVAAVVATDGKFVACHRTYLQQDSDGLWGKARIMDPKPTLGRFIDEHGYIRLWKGEDIDRKPARSPIARSGASGPRAPLLWSPKESKTD